MTIDANILALMLGAAVGAWYCAIWAVRSTLSSCGRYRLWRVRDNVVDDVLAGRLPRDNFAVVALIATCEGVNANIYAHTLLPTLSRRAFSGRNLEVYRRVWRSSIEELTSDEQALLDVRQQEFVRAYQYVIAFGSLASLFAFALYFGFTVVRRLSRRVTDAAVSPLREARADLGRATRGWASSASLVYAPAFDPNRRLAL